MGMSQYSLVDTQAGECSMALAGGVNVITGVHNYFDLAKAGSLRPAGQIKQFDDSADGHFRADGVCLVVFKSLRQSIADHDDMGDVRNACIWVQRDLPYIM